MEGIFRFKHFNVRHDRCALKVGTDGVLLGAWCERCGPSGKYLDACPNIRQGFLPPPAIPLYQPLPSDTKPPVRILDIGTGSGVIALMLAQRFPEASAIVGIEPDIPSAAQAAENFAASPWSTRLKAVPTTMQEYDCPDESFDMIVSNPPFFNLSKENPDERKSAARHTVSLSHDELIKKSASLLKPDGCFDVIIPTDIGDNFISTAKDYGLHLIRKTAVYTTGKATYPKRLLLSFNKATANQQAEETPIHMSAAHPIVQESSLYIKDSSDKYTAEYLQLTHDFYLFA